jgi:hypothetical protein
MRHPGHKPVERKKKRRGKKKMWKVVCKFYSGGKKTIGRFKTYRDADEFVRNPGEEYMNMPCGVWKIEKVREAK